MSRFTLCVAINAILAATICFLGWLVYNGASPWLIAPAVLIAASITSADSALLR